MVQSNLIEDNNDDNREKNGRKIMTNISGENEYEYL